MIITYAYADNAIEWNCSEWRCAIPARAIQRSGEHTAFMIYIGDFNRNTSEIQEICAASDIIVVQRNLFGITLSMIQHWISRDKTVIADFDDAYDLMHPSVRNYEFWSEGKIELRDKNEDGSTRYEFLSPPPLTQFKWALRLTHGATMPCRTLAEDWKKYTQTYIIPNYLELSRYLNAKPVPAHEEIIIGWGGSLSHLQSFDDSGVLKALKNICKSRPKVRLMICGDKRVFDKIDLPEYKKIFAPFVPAPDWPNQLAWFDIGIAPLSGEYDKRRSWIKPLEYMALKIPWVASDYPPYENIRQYGKTVINTPQAWEQELLEMIDNYDDYKDNASKDAFQFAKSQGIDENLPQIISTYATIIRKNLAGDLHS